MKRKAVVLRNQRAVFTRLDSVRLDTGGGRGSGGRGCRRRRGGTNNSLVDQVEIALAVALIILGRVSIPEHHTAEVRVVLVLFNRGSGDGGGNVTSVGGAYTTGHTDIDLGILAGSAAEIADPGIVVEGRLANIAASARVVVKLNEQSIELGVGNQLLHLEESIGQRALRSGRDEEGVWRGVRQLTETLHQRNVASQVLYAVC